MRKAWFNVRFTFVWVFLTIMTFLLSFVTVTVSAGKMTTSELVNIIFNFIELYSGKTLFPYQEQFSKRVIRSILENDGAELTALFARQSGKSETIADTVGGCMIILPILANMPMLAGDKRLEQFRDGLWVGIFAPSQRQAQITYNRIKSRLQSPSAMAVLEDPEFNLQFTTSNGQTCALSNGSFATAISASDGSSIEGESFKLIICEECQDISNYKIRKSIHPMGAAYNATIVKIGTATTFKGDFYDAIQRNKRDYESGELRVRNHFEYDWKVAAKYNPKYAKYVESEKKRLGEKSDEFRMSYCVTPDTRILTADLRYVRADSLVKGDKLVGFDEEMPNRYGQRKFKESVVEDVGKIKRPCYRVTLEDGTAVKCSAEHRWLVFTAGSRTVWKETKDLVTTDRIYKVCNTWESPESDYRLGYLAAAFDGEGCISQVNGKISQLCFAQKDNPMLRKVKQYLTELGFLFGERVDERTKVHKIYLTGGKYEVLRFLGTVRPQRLLENFDINRMGTLRCCKQSERDFVHPHVTNLEYLGEQTVIPIRTSTRTYVAEGLASHNCLEWILVRGMFVDLEIFESNNLEPLMSTALYDMTNTHCAGIDLGGKGDSTVITVVEVNWDMPVIMEDRVDPETGETITYLAYNTYIKAWHEIANEPDYEEQYYEIMDYLGHWRLAKVVCDATREASVSHRLRANLKCDVIPYIFTSKSKSDMYKILETEISSGRARVPASPEVVETPEYKKFLKQLGELQKDYRGASLVVHHPDEKDAHDDYPDSWALALFGCVDRGEVNETETQDKKRFMVKTQIEQSFYRDRNKFTARRR